MMVAQGVAGLDALVLASSPPEECPICYQLQDHMEKLVPCGHRICAECVKKLETFVGGVVDKRCPFCRKKFIVLARPPALVEVCLRRMQWRLPQPDQIQRLPGKLRICLLARCKNRRQLYGDVLMELVRGLSLEVLDLRDATNLKSADLGVLASLLASPPREMHLSNVPLLNDAGLGSLLAVAAPTVENLNIAGASDGLEGASLEHFAQRLPRLAHLNLAGCGNLLSSSFVATAEGVSSTLISLDLSGCRRLGNEAIAGLASCTKLQRLAARGLWKLEAAPVAHVLEACGKLQELDLTHCGRVWGPDVLGAAAGFCTQLRQLMVGALPGIDDDAILALAASTVGSALHCLSISKSVITDNAIRAVQANCPLLQRLDVSDCHDIGESAVVDAIMDMPYLRICQVQYCRHISTSAQMYIGQLLSGRMLGIEDAVPRLKGRASQGPPRRRAAEASLDIDDCCRGSQSATLLAAEVSAAASSSGLPSPTSSAEISPLRVSTSEGDQEEDGNTCIPSSTDSSTSNSTSTSPSA